MPHSLVKRLNDSLRRFKGDEGGATSIIFGIMFTMLLLAAAIAIDWGRGVNEKLLEQEAIDAATLAASDRIGAVDQDTSGPALGRAFFSANTGANPDVVLDSIVLDAEKGEVRAHTENSMRTTLLQVAGFTQIRIGAASTVKKAVGTVELAIVLDNSGSMSSIQSDGKSSIEALKAAATQMANVVLAGAEGTDRVMLGVVPFAASVNVGSHYRGADWIDNAGAGSTHGENFVARDQFTAAKTRFQHYDAMSVGWAGCVEARVAPFDVSDAEPTTSDPRTLFVPMFAPDEPDDHNDGDTSRRVNYPNNYINNVYDDGVSCSDRRTCKTRNRRGTCTAWNPPPALTPAVAQARTCKYDLAVLDTSSGKGPNTGCTTSPVLPLTSTKTDILAAISAMSARGSTNIPEAVMWGWRVLSPEMPFDQGRDWTKSDNQKVLVLMTDGKNEIVQCEGNNTANPCLSNQNKSAYTAFGYGGMGRMGTTHTYAGYQAALNTKTTAACNAAKAKGIRIYTVAFRLTDTMTVNLLKSCASDSNKAFSASDNAGLLAAFQTIGKDISKLRIAG